MMWVVSFLNTLSFLYDIKNKYMKIFRSQAPQVPSNCVYDRNDNDLMAPHSNRHCRENVNNVVVDRWSLPFSKMFHDTTSLVRCCRFTINCWNHISRIKIWRLNVMLTINQCDSVVKINFLHTHTFDNNIVLHTVVFVQLKI